MTTSSPMALGFSVCQTNKNIITSQTSQHNGNHSSYERVDWQYGPAG
jgi:hypothetical protein